MMGLRLGMDWVLGPLLDATLVGPGVDVDVDGCTEVAFGGVDIGSGTILYED